MDPETCIYFCMLGIPSAGDGIILAGVLLLARASRAEARQYMYKVGHPSTHQTPPATDLAQRSRGGAVAVARSRTVNSLSGGRGFESGCEVDGSFSVVSRARHHVGRTQDGVKDPRAFRS